MPSPSVQAVAFYLPQFHPVPENDEWWGRGFTEWTNVARARKRYPRHNQPRLPGELGFYDLRLPETRAAQAALARHGGIAAFCYWHYWFAGRQILERPFAEVLASGEPDFPFCLAWANQSWRGTWHGAPNRILVEQRYPGVDDERAHFETLLPAFHDPRYFRVDGRPLFYLYDPAGLPDAAGFVDRWRTWAERAGLPGLFLVGQTFHGGRSSTADLDAFSIEPPLARLGRSTLAVRLLRRIGIAPVHSYRRFSEALRFEIPGTTSIPMVLPGWDNTPRTGARGVVLHGSRPELFRAQVERAVASLAGKPHQLLFVKSWNEWAEGNYLEPDRRWGRAYLDALSVALRSRDAAHAP